MLSGLTGETNGEITCIERGTQLSLVSEGVSLLLLSIWSSLCAKLCAVTAISRLKRTWSCSKLEDGEGACLESCPGVTTSEKNGLGSCVVILGCVAFFGRPFFLGTGMKSSDDLLFLGGIVSGMCLRCSEVAGACTRVLCGETKSGPPSLQHESRVG